MLSKIDSSIPLDDLLTKLQQEAIKSPSLAGSDISSKIGTQSEYSLSSKESEWGCIQSSEKSIKIIVIDYGLKKNILRSLSSRGASVIVLPRNVSIDEVKSHQPDGVLLSSGPGDPSALADKDLEVVHQITKTTLPVMGICFGYQLLARSLGAKLIQMSCGHHGINHPVQDLRTKKVMITSQNHEFVVEDKNLPPHFEVTHRSLFDHSLEGFEVKGKNIFAYQFHKLISFYPIHQSPLLFHYFFLMFD